MDSVGKFGAHYPIELPMIHRVIDIVQNDHTRDLICQATLLLFR